MQNRPNIKSLAKIRSWIKRHPRLSAAQKECLEKNHLKYHFDKDSLDLFHQTLSEVKDNFEEVLFDIGFGLGHSLIHSAQENPNRLVLGFDPHPNGQALVLKKREELGLNNIFLYAGDCLDYLKSEDEIVLADYIHIFFPDPWPKKRHHKRRLIQRDFLKDLSQALSSEGVVHIATDWSDYARHIQEIIEEESSFISPQSLEEKLKKAQRVSTKYEKRGLDLGHDISDFVLKLSNLSSQ